MLNVLSLELGHHVKGKEINDWCIDQIKNHKSHERDARRLMRKNYSDTRTYALILNQNGSGIASSTERVFMRVF